MRRWALDQLTVVGVRPPELVEIAARAGYDAVSPFIGIGESPLFTVPLIAGDPDTVAMARRLKETGLRLNQVDGFVIAPEFDTDAIRAGLELASTMGANNGVTLIFEPDPSRAFDRLSWLSEAGREAGIGIVLEPTPLSRVPSLEAAVELINRVGDDNLGLLVDIMHLAQAGETPADVAALPAGLVRGAQVCDAPANLDAETYARMAMGERMIPGDGDLPVGDFLSALPEGVIVGVEAPVPSIEDFNERAKTVLHRARSLDTGS